MNYKQPEPHTWPSGCPTINSCCMVVSVSYLIILWHLHHLMKKEPLLLVLKPMFLIIFSLQSTLQEEHSLLTGRQIVLWWLPVRLFLVVLCTKNSDWTLKRRLLIDCRYKTILGPVRSDCSSCRVREKAELSREFKLPNFFAKCIWSILFVSLDNI